MNLYENIIKTLSNFTNIEEKYIFLTLGTLLVFLIFSLLKKIGIRLIKLLKNEKHEYLCNKTFQISINIIECIMLLFVWDDYIKSLMTFISFISAAMAFAIRDIILNFFCGIYINIKKPFKVEDRIIIDNIKGDVMNISSMNFEILEIDSSQENGQSTGVIVTFPNSVVISKPIKNITKGFKYIWNEMFIKIKIDCDLAKNKQEIYKIINNMDIVKNIPKKMQSQISNASTNYRIYFNKYEPMIYTKIIDNYIQLSLRYLIHPKKARFTESVIWNKIFLAYKENKIDLYID